MTDPVAVKLAERCEAIVAKDDVLPKAKPRRSIFSAVRDLNATMYPDLNYRNQLLEEAKKWKGIIRNAFDLSSPNNTPNVSTSQDMSMVPKMRAYVEDKPDLERFLKENQEFYKQTEKHFAGNKTLERLNEISDMKRKLIMEISNDICEDILYKC